LDSKLMFFLKCKKETITNLPTLATINFQIGKDQFVCARDPAGSKKTMNANNWIGYSKDKAVQCVLSTNSGQITGQIVRGNPKTMKVTRYSLKTLLVDKQFVWVRVGKQQARRPPGKTDTPRFALSAVRAPIVVNVQVGYTPTAAAESDGDAKLKTKIANAIAGANVALLNSKTGVTIVAVGTLKTKTDDIAANRPEISPVLTSLVTDKTTKWVDIWTAAKKTKRISFLW